MTIIRQNGSELLQYQATAVSNGAFGKCYGPSQAYQAVATASSGAYTATIVIEGSNDGATGITLGTISLSSTAPTVATDGFVTGQAPWAYVRARVTAITGVGTSVSTWMAC